MMIWNMYKTQNEYNQTTEYSHFRKLLAYFYTTYDCALWFREIFVLNLWIILKNIFFYDLYVCFMKISLCNLRIYYKYAAVRQKRSFFSAVWHINQWQHELFLLEEILAQDSKPFGYSSSRPLFPHSSCIWLIPIKKEFMVGTLWGTYFMLQMTDATCY